MCLDGKNMKKQTKNQEELITKEIVKEAAAEQLKSRGADDGLDKGRRGSIATPQQMFGIRRRADAIIIGLIDDWSDPKIRERKIWDRIVQSNLQLQKPATKRKTHRGGRSQESLMTRAIRK